MAVAEAALQGGNGARLEIALDGTEPESWLGALFGETQSRFVISASPQLREDLEEMARRRDVPLRRLGATGGPSLHVGFGDEGPDAIDVPLDRLRVVYEGTLGA